MFMFIRLFLMNVIVPIVSVKYLDLCYSAPGHDRAACDKAFYENLLSVCTSPGVGTVLHRECEISAFLMYTGVNIFGDKYYKKGVTFQAVHCGECADGSCQEEVEHEEDDVGSVWFTPLQYLGPPEVGESESDEDTQLSTAEGALEDLLPDIPLCENYTIAGDIYHLVWRMGNL
ncbi:hypothetical protein KIPB_007198 [Kipferlia bialata]|uniref:Uncharacterized protein n=1 Tax=Kipferlia bialata TaxID=797122 RepID=A0A9K3CZN1_9EUKA|nr:hypothetical protein KIPB_007198 [Kipferlia bialata]|eukprot:g7198.t1